MNGFFKFIFICLFVIYVLPVILPVIFGVLVVVGALALNLFSSLWTP